MTDIARDEAPTAYERLTTDREPAPRDLGFARLTGYELGRGWTITREEYLRRLAA